MENVVEKYNHKKRQKKNIFILFTSLFLALGINIILFTGSPGTTGNLSASIYNPNGVYKSTAQVYLETDKLNTTIYLTSNTLLQNVKYIHFELSYDKSILDIKNILSNIGGEVKILSEYPKMVTIFFSEPKTIEAGTILTKIPFIKNSEYPSSINITNTYFSTEEKKFELTNEGILLQ